MSIRTLSAVLALWPACLLRGQTLVATIPTTPQPAITHPGQMVFNAGNNKLYVAGNEGIAVLDGSTNKRIGAIVLNTTESVTQLAANPTTNRVYAQTLSTITVIDSMTDTIVQTFSPGVELLGMAYLPALDRVFVLQFDGTTIQVVIRDGATLSQIAVALAGVDSGGSAIPQAPIRLVAVPGANRVLGYYIEPPAPSTFLWFFDGVTGAVVDHSDCSSTTICLKIIGGSIQNTIVNPLDNKVWGYAIVQTTTVGGGGDEAGSGPIPFPESTALAPIDFPLPFTEVGNFNVWGGFTPLAFDRSGKIVGAATCVPSTPTPSASQNPCLGLASGLYTVGSSTPLGTFGQLIDLNHFLGGPGGQTTSLCNGVPLGYDPDLGYGYFSCNGFGNGAVGEITVIKYDLTQAPDTSFFPPRIVGQWIGSLKTHALNFPQAIGAMVIHPVTHRAFFENPPDNSILSVDPSAPSLLTELLSSRPAAVVVNPATNTVILAEDTAAQITTVDATAKAVTGLHIQLANGPFVGVNPATNQIVAAGSADDLLDHSHTANAFLYNGAGTTLVRGLSAAAVGGVIFDPSTLTGQGVTVNAVTNRAYFLDQAAWYVVDLATGNRIFTGNDFTGSTVPNQCQFSGLAVDSKANRYYVVGQCPWSQAGNFTIGSFDGTTNAPINTATLANFTTGSGGGWGKIAVNPNTNRLYLELLQVTIDPVTATATVTTMVVTYDAASLTRFGMPITATGGPMLVSFPLAIDTNTNRIYATVSTSTSPTASPQMVELDGGVDAFGRTDVVIGTVPMQVRAVGVNESTGLVYVASDTLLALPGGVLQNQPGLNVFHETPLPAKFTLSGTVTTNGVGLAAIRVGISSSNGEGTDVITDASGAYSLPGLVAGTYTVKPVTPTFAYTPVSQSVTLSTANVPGVNFTAVPAFHVSGFVLDGNGNGIALQSVGNAQLGGSVTDATGAFTLSNVVPGTYTLLVEGAGAACCFLSQTVTVTNADITGVTFKQLPKVVIAGLSFSPTMIGGGVISTGTVTLTAPAPPGGIVVNILTGGSTIVKAPSTLTIAEGTTSGTFTVKGSGVTAPTGVNFTVQYSGVFSPDKATAANAVLTVAPTDSLKVTSATWSQSTHLLTVNATGTNSQATLTVILSSTKAPLGTMVNQGGGNFTFQMLFTAGIPASINLTSNLGGSTGQGVTVTP